MFYSKANKLIFFALTLVSMTAIAASPSVITVSTDNDLFSPIQNDRDYTAGAALAYSGVELENSWNVWGRGLNGIDDLLIDSNTAARQGPGAIEFGAYGFTPEEIAESRIVEDDRPYSSLVYISASQSRKVRNSQNSWTSSFTVGVLGLDLFENAQNAIHKAIDSPRANGWKHQISDGGEPTMRYSLAYHSPIGDVISDNQFKTTVFGSAGYLTEFGAALVFRDGLIASPSERFNPELSTYGENATGIYNGRANESYFWGGIAMKARLYNAFLQGQFRQSKHTLSSSDLEPVVFEGWAGYTQSFMGAYKFSYVLRVQTSEIKEGAGDRLLAWGSLILSKTF